MAEITHSLERTSHFSEPFVGRCVLCGAWGMTMADALKPCPNPRGLTSDEALLEAIESPEPDDE